MEVFTDIPIKHYESFTRHEPVVLDNSNIKEYKLCPRRYFYRVVLGFTTPENPPYFIFGRTYHKFRERLEINFRDFINAGDSKQIAIAKSLGQSLNEAMECWKNEAAKNRPTYSSDGKGKFDFLTLDRLKQSCTATFAYWQKEKEAGNIKVISTEQPFTIQLPSGDWYGGRADQLIEHNGKIRGRDFKTTTKFEPYYKRSFVPNAQFAGYTYVEAKLHGRDVRGQIVEVLYNTKTTDPRLVPYPVDFTREQLDEWEKGTMHWLSLIRKSREEDDYPLNEEACNFCPFHAVCQMPSETARGSVLKSMYKKQIWDHANDE